MTITRPDLIPQPFAADGDKNVILDTPPSTSSNLASWSKGWQSITETDKAAGGLPPERKDFNGIFNALSAHTVYQQAGGGYQFDQDFANAIGGYPKGARLLNSDKTGVWVNLVDGNASDPEGIDAAGWFIEINKFHSISALPTQNIGPIIVIECAEVWLWSESAYFTGYRSPLCGRPLDGHTVTPLISEIDAVGGTLSKTAYARLWGYAQENGLVVASASWVAGTHNFVDVDTNNFRVPDLRNMFRRYTGTDADTANARTLGSRQADDFKSHAHTFTLTSDETGTGYATNGKTAQASQTTNATGGTETRPINVAFMPRIHV